MQHFTASLKLKASRDEQIYLEKCFRCCERIEQVMQTHAQKQIRKLRQDAAYLSALQDYRKATNSTGQEAREIKTRASRILSERRKHFGLSEYDFHAFIKIQQHKYSNYVSSDVAQKIASRVYQSVEAALFRNGKQLHFRKYGTLRSFEAKRRRSGIVFKSETEKGAPSVTLHQHVIYTVPVREKDAYLQECVRRYKTQGCYCRVKRFPTTNGWDYYVELIIKGMPPEKESHHRGEGRVGIDIGTSSIAAVAKNACVLEALDEGVADIEKETARIRRAMDRSRRATNPQNYNLNGTPCKGCKTWNKSERYKKLARRLKNTYAKRTRILKQAQECRANRILALGDELYMEKMYFKGLTRRAKETTFTSTGRPRSKERFGHSIGIRAPAQQVAILKRKLAYSGKTVAEVNTRTFRASQYDHVADTYTKKPLSQRTARIGGHLVQRDLYSAFLLMNADGTLERTDRELCIKNFPGFLRHHEMCISALLEDGGHALSSFGLKAFRKETPAA